MSDAAPAPNKENIRLWVDALRSGKYSQAIGVLAARKRGQDKMSFCCLGVACEVALENGVDLDVKENWDSTNNNQYLRMYNNNAHLLPKEVYLWLGFDDVTAEVPRANLPESLKSKVPDYKSSVSLNGLNDSLGATFEDIADAIEKEFLQ